MKQIKKISFTTLGLAICMLMSRPAHAECPLSTKSQNLSKWTAILGPYIYLNAKRPQKNFTPRYSVSEILKLHNIPENLWYLFDDGFVGQLGKSSVLRVGDGGTLSFTETIEPAGLLGTMDTYFIKSCSKALGSIIALIALKNVLKTGDINPDNLYPLLKK